MKTIRIEKEIKDFIVFSDVHLRHPGDQVSSLFLKTLRELLRSHAAGEQRLDALFFLGDIFDFIFVSKNFFLVLWQDFFLVCRYFQQAGVSVYFVEGNHDFGFEHFFPKVLKHSFTFAGDICLEFFHQNLGRVVLRHGDDVVCSARYLLFRSIVKSFYFQRFSSFFLYGSLAHRVFSFYAKVSRKRGTYHQLSSSFLQKSLLCYLNNEKKLINTFIFGHIHVFLDSCFLETHILVGPDWFFAPNYLYCDSHGKIKRIFLTEKIAPLFLL